MLKFKFVNSVLALAFVALAPMQAKADSMSIGSLKLDFGQGSSPLNAEQQAFYTAYKNAVNSDDAAALLALYHPAGQACLTDAANKAYGDYMISRELKNTIPDNAVVQVVSDKAALAELNQTNAMTTQPVAASLILALDWSTAKYSGTTLLRQLAEQDGKLYLVPACLTAKGHEAFASKMAAEKGEVGK